MLSIENASTAYSPGNLFSLGLRPEVCFNILEVHNFIFFKQIRAHEGYCNQTEILLDTTDIVTKAAFTFPAKLAICSHSHVSLSKREMHMQGCQLFQQHSQIFSLCCKLNALLKVSPSRHYSFWSNTAVIQTLCLISFPHEWGCKSKLKYGEKHFNEFHWERICQYNQPSKVESSGVPIVSRVITIFVIPMKWDRHETFLF